MGSLYSFRSRRAGFTMTEALAALAIFAVLAVVVAQCVVWSLRERAKHAAHHAAIEIAANVLEEARAMPFEHLDEAWANGQAIPSEMAGHMASGKVLVTLEADKIAPGAKIVHVEVRWQAEAEASEQSVKMTTVLGPRSRKTEGGKP